MSQNDQFQQIASEAANPNVDPNRLRQIAAEYPGLHVIIAQNPAAYDGLLDWLASQGKPEVVAAIAARRGQSTELPQQMAPQQPASQQPAPMQSGPMLAAPQQPVPMQGAPMQGAPMQSGPMMAAPASAQAAVTPEAAEKKSLWVVIVFIVLALLAIVSVVCAVGIATGMFNGLFSDGSSKQATSPKVVASVEGSTEQDSESNSGDEANADSDSEATAEPTSENQIKYPEPAGSQALPVFSSPSQNIFCSIKVNEAFCAISTRDFAKDGPDACFGIFGMKITGDGQAVTTCNDPSVNAMPGSATVLPYGSSASNDKYACTMSESGVSCWNKFTGAQFSLRRAAFQVEQR